jgi:hypothetical protein
MQRNSKANDSCVKFEEQKKRQGIGSNTAQVSAVKPRFGMESRHSPLDLLVRSRISHAHLTVSCL